MLFPRSHAWTSRQKTLIALGVVFGLTVVGGLVYSYERYFRALREADLVGTWTRVDPGTAGGYYEFRRDGTVVPLDEDGQPTDTKGKWRIGGTNIYVRFPPGALTDHQLAVWHIVDISRDQFRVRFPDGGIMIWRRMKPIPRPPLDFSDIPTTTVDVNQ